MLLITQTALELGFLYALVAMALFLSFRILNIADMTTDGALYWGRRCPSPCLPPGIRSGHPRRHAGRQLRPDSSLPFADPAGDSLHSGQHRHQHGAVHREPHGHGLESQPEPAGE